MLLNDTMMSLNVSLNDDGVLLTAHEARRGRICMSDDVLDGNDECENVSILSLIFCS